MSRTNRATTRCAAVVLVLAVFLGGLLPISVFFVEYLERREANRNAEVVAPVKLQAALDHLDLGGGLLGDPARLRVGEHEPADRLAHKAL